jgi:hypothetical protein
MPNLPEDPVAAAAWFYQRIVPQVHLADDSDVTVLFPGVTHAHEGWMRAAVQGLARAAAPRRINGVAGNEPGAIDATVDWLDQAPGITGQLLVVDGTEAPLGAS